MEFKSIDEICLDASAITQEVASENDIIRNSNPETDKNDTA